MDNLNEVPKFVKSTRIGEIIYYQYYYKGWFYTFPLNMHVLQVSGTINITDEVKKFKEDIDKLLLDLKEKNYTQLKFTDFGIN